MVHLDNDMVKSPSAGIPTWNHHNLLVHFIPVVQLVKHPVQDEVAVVSHHRTLMAQQGITL